MKRTKILSIVLIVAMLAAFPIGTALAATGTTSVLGTGTIQSITLKTDPITSITSVIVTLLDGSGGSQSVTISLETAITMGLVIPNAAMITGLPVVITDPAAPLIELVNGTIDKLTLVTDPITKVTSLTIDWTDLLLAPQVTTLEIEKAVALGFIAVDPTKISSDVVIDPVDILESATFSQNITLLEKYFGTALGLTPDQLQAYKDGGFGYGEIAQAAWIATDLGGDAALLDQILTAKSSGDFSTLVLPDGVTVTNWGQLRKAILSDPHQNLGSIVSGHADPLAPVVTSESSTTTHGKSNGHGHGNGHGKGGH